MADYDNNAIRKVTAAGVVTTLAGTGMSGSADGTGSTASFNGPTGVAVDSAGNLYVADYRNSTIRRVTTAGVVTTLAGTAGMFGNADGTGTGARFNSPSGVAVDSAGNVYVADFLNSTIRKVTAAGVVTTLAGTAGMFGSADGTGTAASFNHPTSVAVDTVGDVYVADRNNSTIRKVTAAGVVTTLAGTSGMSGSADGAGAAARFNNPQGVGIDSAGNVYVADDGNSSVRKVTPGGVVTTLAGISGSPGSADGTGAAARFNNPQGVAIDSAGNVYIADDGNSSIRKVTSAGVVTTLAGTADMPGSLDGTGTAARFNKPSGVAVDSGGNVYVADERNSIIRKVTAAGVVTTLAGLAGWSGSLDGTGTTARFNYPTDVAVDSADNVYVADQSNHVIRKVTTTGVVTTLAGAARIGGSADGTGTEARFYYPSGVAVDHMGNVYVADQNNHTIRRITAAGVVTTLAGAPGISGSMDGTGANAHFYYPVGVAVDTAGNVYVTDQSNCTVRKITAAGVVTTLAGTAGVFGNADGTGAAARFSYPFGVTVDSASNVYIADGNNSIIRKVTPTGTTTTIVGPAGVSGILLGATPRFALPLGLAIVDDSFVLSDANAILLLRHGAR